MRRPRDAARDMLIQARYRAKRDGIPFDLTLSDIVIPEVCPVLGIPLRVKDDGTYGPADHSPSLDRLVPERGYVKGNTVVVSYRCNRIKNNSTVAELLNVAAFYQQVIP